MSRKEYVQANDLVRDAFALARQIYDSGYAPEVILGLWRGGTPVGIVVHEFLLYKGLETYHAAVKAVSYEGIEKRVRPRIEQLDSVMAAMRPGARVLVIDDIFDTGNTVDEVVRQLAPRTEQVKVATLYYKEGTNQTDREPDYFVRKTTDWIVFPHELMDLTPEEIQAKDAYVYRLLRD